jgi:type I restriction enzyme M protein
MNLAIRGIEADLGPENADSFRRDLHPDLKADFILANPPFNDSHWNGELLRDDVRWKYGIPPVGNANFAWVQHFIHHLAPKGIAGFVLANGSLSSQQSGEGDIRKTIVDADLVDCVVAMPGQLFYSTQIPVCLWFLAKTKEVKKLRARSGEILFIDARAIGHLVDRTHRDLSDADIERITSVYHSWRGETEPYADVPGFCATATTKTVATNGYVLTPGRYVGTETTADDDEPVDVRIERLIAKFREESNRASDLNGRINEILKQIGYAV